MRILRAIEDEVGDCFDSDASAVRARRRFRAADAEEVMVEGDVACAELS